MDYYGTFNGRSATLTRLNELTTGFMSSFLLLTVTHTYIRKNQFGLQNFPSFVQEAPDNLLQQWKNKYYYVRYSYFMLFLSLVLRLSVLLRLQCIHLHNKWI